MPSSRAAAARGCAPLRAHAGQPALHAGGGALWRDRGGGAGGDDRDAECCAEEGSRARLRVAELDLKANEGAVRPPRPHNPPPPDDERQQQRVLIETAMTMAQLADAKIECERRSRQLVRHHEAAPAPGRGPKAVEEKAELLARGRGPRCAEEEAERKSAEATPRIKETAARSVAKARLGSPMIELKRDPAHHLLRRLSFLNPFLALPSYY